jgi:hypothetical protein
VNDPSTAPTQDNDPYKTDFTYKTTNLNSGMNYGAQGNTAKYGFEMRNSEKQGLDLPTQSQPALKLTLNPDTYALSNTASTGAIKNEFLKKPQGNFTGPYEGRGLVLPPANDSQPENKRNNLNGDAAAPGRFFGMMNNNTNNISSSSNNNNNNNNNNFNNNNFNNGSNLNADNSNNTGSRDFSKLGLPASSKLDEFMSRKNEELANNQKKVEDSPKKTKTPVKDNATKVKGLEKVEEVQIDDMKNYPQTTKVRTLRNLKGSEDTSAKEEESEYLKMKTISGPSRPERRKSPGTGERKPPVVVKPTGVLTKADILIASSDEDDDNDGKNFANY